MEESVIKLREFEGSLLNWFISLFIMSAMLLYFEVSILATIALWSCFLVIIARSIIRIFDICFVMNDKNFVIRLLLIAINFTVLYIAIIIFLDLLSMYDFPAIWEQAVLKFEALKERLLSQD
jgi:hypothetical protein